MERYFEISNALIKSEGAAWDDHNGGSEIKLKGMAALVIGDQAIPVGLHHGDYFSLNRVYLKDGKVHLSQESVGGTLFPANFSDLWECIIDYNEKQVGNKFSCGTLENPMSLKPVPVTVITMNVEEFNAKKHLRAFATQAGILPSDDAECAAAREVLTEAIGGKEVKQLISKSEAGPWLLDKLDTEGGGSAGAFLPPPRTQAEVEELGMLVASGLSPEEANKQFVSRRSAERITMLNDAFDQGTKIVGTPNPDDEYVHLKLGELPIDSQRKLTSLNVDFLPGDEDEIQEAYYREMLAKKETGVVPTGDLGKEIPFVAGYAGHKDPSKP